jgi:transposase-like protein
MRRYFALHEQRRKALADPNYRSQRLRGIGVLLYVMGLSYGRVMDVLAAFGWRGSKSSIYRDVQAAGEAVTCVRRQESARPVQVISADATYVRCCGQEVTVAVAIDALAGDVLEVELVDGESADALRDFFKRLQQEYGLEVLVSDDQDSYKVLADEMGIGHAICRAHVNRNVAQLIGQLSEQALELASPPPPGVMRSQDELLADLEYCQLLIALRPSDGAAQLAQLHRYYQAAAPPAKGEKATLWYRFRLALLRWWNNWHRLTFDQRWNPHHASQQLDGTNNVAERAIGCYIKERYRTMRTYKRVASVRNLAQLIPFLAARPDQPALTQLLVA